MMFFARSNRNRPAIARLYGDIVAGARHPGLFERFAVADTFEGRFEALALCATLVLRRLAALPPPADQVAQDLVDHIFADLDRALRTIGIGDLSVPKKMKTLAAAFYGRAAAYTGALSAGAENLALLAALERNLYGGEAPSSAILRALAECVTEGARRMDAADLAALLAGGAAICQWEVAPATRLDA